MNYKIVEKESFCIIEKAETHTTENGENLKSIPDFWVRSHRDGTVSTIMNLASDKDLLFGICYASAGKEKTFEYSIAAIYDGDADLPSGLRKSTVPARTWAVFECIGAMPDAIQDMWRRIDTEFFDAAGLIPTHEMDIEAYGDGDTSSPDYHSEIWIPVVKK